MATTERFECLRTTLFSVADERFPVPTGQGDTGSVAGETECVRHGSESLSTPFPVPPFAPSDSVDCGRGRDDRTTVERARRAVLFADAVILYRERPQGANAAQKVERHVFSVTA
ncbi:hypothetical protein SAMN04487948_104432 [Halogranum amylolyticum]|uniref:Uncharacterized protein n=1 Tax=Halogranum amylolyticum TaxID=660520 RepID=A0A1H8S4H0_9EURY|nr:hypothetical protein SAMN04487948_104432 [Halogranum amylolyticum]